MNKKNKKRIFIDRDSVCAADDVKNHFRKFLIPDTCKTFEELFRLIDASGFIPKPIAGNQEIWVLCKQKRVEILVYNRATDSFINSLVDMSFKTQLKEDMTLDFCYFASPEERAKHIFRLNEGSYYYMHHDGWIQEYQTYGISKEMEEQWKRLFNLKG